MGNLFQIIGKVLGLPSSADLQGEVQQGIDQATLAIQILIAEGAVIVIEGFFIAVMLWKMKRKG